MKFPRAWENPQGVLIACRWWERGSFSVGVYVAPGLGGTVIEIAMGWWAYSFTVTR